LSDNGEKILFSEAKKRDKKVFQGGIYLLDTTVPKKQGRAMIFDNFSYIY